jgi:chromosomal replication initiator protein
MNTYDLLWQKILNELESTFNEETYADVFEPLKSTHKYANDHVYVLVPNEFIKNRINRLYLSKINELATKFNNAPIRFKFVTESELVT